MSIVRAIHKRIYAFHKQVLEECNVHPELALADINNLEDKYLQKIQNHTIDTFMKDVYSLIKYAKTDDSLIIMTARLLYKYLLNPDTFFAKEGISNNKKSRITMAIYISTNLLDELQRFSYVDCSR